MNAPKKIVSIIVILVIVAAAGYAVYETLGLPPKSGSVVSEPSPRSPLDHPTSSSTQEYRQKYMNLIGEAAEETNTVSIASCTPSPLVTRVKKGSALTFMNADSVSHTLYFDPDHTYVLATSSKLAIEADFGSAVGAFPYSCDSLDVQAGIILVQEE